MVHKVSVHLPEIQKLEKEPFQMSLEIWAFTISPVNFMARLTVESALFQVLSTSQLLPEFICLDLGEIIKALPSSM